MQQDTKNLGGRPKGYPKTGGRTKGTPNKATASFKEKLDTSEFDVATELIKYYKTADMPQDLRLKALQLLLEYSQYKPKAPDTADTAPPTEASQALAEVTPEQLLKLVDEQ
jgi:hypothetical protein